MLKKLIKPHRLNRLVCITAVVLILGGCSTTPTATISESDGRVTLGYSYIGEVYGHVITRAASEFKVEPHCENRKVGMKNSRKAFLYAVCGFNPLSAQFAQAPLSEVVYHFIDQQLVRIDVRARGETALLDQVKDDMHHVFASRNAQLSEIGKSSYQWTATGRVAGVRAGGGASTGHVHVRLLDQSLIDSAPWLAME